MTPIPTFAQLYQDVKADLEAEFGASIPAFGKNALRVLAIIRAAELKIFYLLVGKTQKNIFADTADPESMGGTLERFGRVKLNRNPFPAVAGEYSFTVTGTIGSTINASTTFKTNDDSLNPGRLYILDASYTLITTSDSVTLRALEAGVDSKLLVGDKVTATSPIVGVDKIATVISLITDPKAAESTEDYRAKTIQAYRLEPNGGSSSDYRLWADDAQGVKQVYPYATPGSPWNVDLYVEATVADSTDGKGTPSAPLLLAVEAVVEQDPDVTKPLNERARRPIGVIVNYLPIIVKDIDIQITGFVGLTAPIQTAIYNAILSEINKIRPFIAGADVFEEKNDIFDVNRIAAIILNVRPGAQFGAIQLSVDAVVVTTYTFNFGNIPSLDTVNYV